MQNFFDMSINIPVVTPDILMAIALVSVFALFRSFTSIFDPGMLTLIIAHVTFEISFVVLVVQSRLVSIGSEQIEAARDLSLRRALRGGIGTTVVKKDIRISDFIEKK